jgi:clan AA aspartic protease (TIGR02281 family)
VFEIALSKESNTLLLPRVEISGPHGSLSEAFILDTGAAYSMISWNIAALLGFDLNKNKHIVIVTGNGNVSAPVVVLDSMRVGNVIVEKVICICHDILGLNNTAGLLGLSFLKHVRTLIDYHALLLRID